MAQVQQLICDRCGAAVKSDASSAGKRLMRYDTDYHGTRIDLCDRCSDQFKAWLEDRTGPPPGYKYQQRPCPHSIPCADPQGCSGQELVPI